ncbi:MAG TPA: YdbH domain-containing protein, partial [Phenylobacterium sp.]
LRHEDASGRGEFQIDTGALAFAPEGLQPADLAPNAALLASPATGEVRFVGGFSWSKAGETSGGRLSVTRLDFQGPIGPIVGLTGEVELTNLAPLETAPDQVLKAERIQAFAPITDVVARGRIQGEAVHVAEAVMTVGQGRVTVEPFTAPFNDPNATFSGAMRLDDIQLSDLVEASPLAESVDLVAKVDGRVPFQVGPAGVRITSGELHAVEPGRLSIKREALTSVAAEGGAPEAPPNLTVDFAYQAMENLAFSQLSAQIDSRPQGRLGVLFHIAGEHAPPKRQELRLSYWELLGRKFMERVHPLPSGVKVDLTLDTSVNLDQLLADWGEYQSLIGRQRRGSATVQPGPGIKTPETTPGARP